jgi:hypothetical protein
MEGGVPPPSEPQASAGQSTGYHLDGKSTVGPAPAGHKEGGASPAGAGAGPRI